MGHTILVEYVSSISVTTFACLPVGLCIRSLVHVALSSLFAYSRCLTLYIVSAYVSPGIYPGMSPHRPLSIRPTTRGEETDRKRHRCRHLVRSNNGVESYGVFPDRYRCLSVCTHWCPSLSRFGIVSNRPALCPVGKPQLKRRSRVVPK